MCRKWNQWFYDIWWGFSLVVVVVIVLGQIAAVITVDISWFYSTGYKLDKCVP